MLPSIESRFLEYDKDKEEVSDFLIKNASYLIYQDGQEITKETTKEVFYGEMPMNKSYEDKQIIGYYQDKRLICIVDVLKNYPINKTWVIGLMLLDEEKRGQKIGKKIYSQIESYMQKNSVEVIRLGVLEDNILGKLFWKKNGFIDNGTFKLHSDNRKIIVCEKSLNKI